MIESEMTNFKNEKGMFVSSKIFDFTKIAKKYQFI